MKWYIEISDLLFRPNSTIRVVSFGLPKFRVASPTGYKNYAERAIQGSMAGSTVAVKEFIDETHDQLRPSARDEMYEMEKFKVRF